MFPLVQICWENPACSWDKEATTMAPSFGWDHLFVGGLITVAAASQIFKVISERREQRLIRFCQKMPKIDLHAHLSGCVRPSTLLELSKNKGTELSIQAERLLSASSYIKRESRTLSECFEIFNLIHSIMNNKETLRRVVYEALYDFYHDNVVYLELRTTPRQLPDGTSKREYIETVLEVIRSFTSDKKCFHVKLLLSIDRASRDFEDSKNTMNLCIEYYIKDNLVVGVDVGGNPTKGSLEYLEPILLQAKEHNIPITLHCGEVCNDKEMEFVLNFNPNRLGHALFLNHSHVNELLSRPKALKIPIELCPTSNMKTLLLETLDHHPTAKRWMTEGEISSPIFLFSVYPPPTPHSLLASVGVYIYI